MTLKFTKLLGKHHPNIFEFVEAIRKEQAATELKLAQRSHTTTTEEEEVPDCEPASGSVQTGVCDGRKICTEFSACSFTLTQIRVTFICMEYLILSTLYN